MIDTDKYEGHTDGGWYVDDAPDVIHPTVIHANDPNWDNPLVAELVMANAEEWTEEDYANARLIADAPLLLADNKRMREENSILKNALRSLVNVYELVLPDKHAEVWYEVNRILEVKE
tara:strand:+ start:75 stop:428 length:354 start_codon:yes stop_codon:yes gene_type:complete